MLFPGTVVYDTELDRVAVVIDVQPHAALVSDEPVAYVKVRYEPLMDGEVREVPLDVLRDAGAPDRLLSA